MGTFTIPTDFVNNVLQNGVTKFSVGLEVTRLINSIMKTWKLFIRESDEYKNEFHISKSRGWNPLPVYKRRLNCIEESFYFHPNSFESRISKGIFFSRYNHFLMDLRSLHKISVDASLKISELLDKRLPGRYIMKRIKECHTKTKAYHTLCLKYYSQPIINNNEVVIDEPHFVGNAWSFVYKETAPGLRFGLESEKKYNFESGIITDFQPDKNYIWPESDVLFFPGAKLEKLTHKNIKMACPSVVSAETQYFELIFSAQTSLPVDIINKYIKER